MAAGAAAAWGELMQPMPEITLHDVHQLPAPPWWPPAPGWWGVLMLLLVMGGLAFAWARYRRRKRMAIERLFDDAVTDAGDAPAQVAAISALLRRASRRHRADADVLEGEDWLKALDEGAKAPLFRSAAGRLILDGGYRRDLDPADVEVLRGIARERFLQWMGVAR